jgi:hypothetical protein
VLTESVVLSTGLLVVSVVDVVLLVSSGRTATPVSFNDPGRGPAPATRSPSRRPPVSVVGMLIVSCGATAVEVVPGAEQIMHQ